MQDASRDDLLFLDNDARIAHRSRPVSTTQTVRPRRVTDSDSFMLITPTAPSNAHEESTELAATASPAPRKTVGSRHALLMQSFDDDSLIDDAEGSAGKAEHRDKQSVSRDGRENKDKGSDDPLSPNGADAAVAAEGNAEFPVILTSSILSEYYLFHNPKIIPNVEQLLAENRGQEIKFSNELKVRYGQSLVEFIKNRQPERAANDLNGAATPSEQLSSAAVKPAAAPSPSPIVPAQPSADLTRNVASMSTFSSQQQQEQLQSLINAPAELSLSRREIVADASVTRALLQQPSSSSVSASANVVVGEMTASSPRQQDLSVQDALRLYYAIYAPEKIRSIDHILEAYGGDVSGLSAALEKKYHAPLYSVTSRALGAPPPSVPVVEEPGVATASSPRRSQGKGASTSPSQFGRLRAANTAPLPQSPKISRNLQENFSTSPSTAASPSVDQVSERLDAERAELALALENANRKAEELLLQEEELFQQRSIVEDEMKVISERQLECENRERLIEKLENTYLEREEKVHAQEQRMISQLAENDALAAKLTLQENKMKREFVEAYHLLDAEKQVVLKLAAELSQDSDELKDLARRLQLTVGEAGASFRFRTSILRDRARVVESKHRETLAAEACSLYPVASSQYERVDIFGKVLVLCGLLVVLMGVIGGFVSF